MQVRHPGCHFLPLQSFLRYHLSTNPKGMVSSSMSWAMTKTLYVSLYIVWGPLVDVREPLAFEHMSQACIFPAKHGNHYIMKVVVHVYYPISIDAAYKGMCCTFWLSLVTFICYSDSEELLYSLAVIFLCFTSNTQLTIFLQHPFYFSSQWKYFFYVNISIWYL